MRRVLHLYIHQTTQRPFLSLPHRGEEALRRTERVLFEAPGDTEFRSHGNENIGAKNSLQRQTSVWV